MHPLTSLTVPAGAVAIHWFEQASFAIKDAAGTIVLVDPYFPHERPAAVFLHAVPPLAEADLPSNFVLLTHAHSDHTHPETIRRIRAVNAGATYVGPAESTSQIVAEAGIDPAKTVTVAAGQAAQLGTMTAHAVYAKPPQGDPVAGIKPPDTTHLGYVLRAGGIGIYISGDPIHTFADHAELTGPVAALKPDIGLITCHPSEGEFPFFDGAALMARRTGLAHVVPAHYACFVSRNYDPHAWAASMPHERPRPIVIPRNAHIVYPG